MKAREILIEEGNVQYVDSPVTVSVEQSQRWSGQHCQGSEDVTDRRRCWFRYVVTYMANSST
jgi:hypothetical protein